MKKIFLFAAAVVAALTVNAKVINLNGIVDTTSVDNAKSSMEAAFYLTNVYIKGEPDSKGKPYAQVYQKDATTDWETSLMEFNADDQVTFAFKDGNADKLVLKAYESYFQPNGKSVCLIISGLYDGDKIKLNFKSALNKKASVDGAKEGALIELNAATIELTASGEEIRLYSKDNDANAEAKWQIVSIEVPGEQGIEDVKESVKAVKTFENGQLVIIKNGVKYNALGAQL